MYTDHTTNLELPQWLGSDKPNWDIDLNEAFRKIDDNSGIVSNEIAGISGDIGEVESTVTALQGEVTSLSDNLDSTNTRVSALESTDASHSASISKLNNDVTALDTKVNTLEGSVNTLEPQVTLNTQNITGLDTRVTALESGTTGDFTSKFLDALARSVVTSTPSNQSIWLSEFNPSEFMGNNLTEVQFSAFKNVITKCKNNGMSDEAIGRAIASETSFNGFVNIPASSKCVMTLLPDMEKLIISLVKCVENLTWSVGKTYADNTPIYNLEAVNGNNSSDFSLYNFDWSNVNLNLKVLNSSTLKAYFTKVSGVQPLSSITKGYNAMVFLRLPDFTALNALLN